MSPAQDNRLARLERAAGDRPVLLVWCDDPEHMESTIAEMIERGELTADDRERVLFVHWQHATAAGAHEAALAELG